MKTRALRRSRRGGFSYHTYQHDFCVPGKKAFESVNKPISSPTADKSNQKIEDLQELSFYVSFDIISYHLREEWCIIVAIFRINFNGKPVFLQLPHLILFHNPHFESLTLRKSFFLFHSPMPLFSGFSLSIFSIRILEINKEGSARINLSMDVSETSSE